jgi:uncharacterized protein (TIGR00251 family)
MRGQAVKPVKSKKSPHRSKAEATPVSLAVRIQPRASKNEITRMDDGRLKIRLTAPPVDGAANEALVTFLADRFRVGRSQVEIVSGHKGREKVIRITGIGGDAVQRLLNSPKE